MPYTNRKLQNQAGIAERLRFGKPGAPNLLILWEDHLRVSALEKVASITIKFEEAWRHTFGDEVAAAKAALVCFHPA